MNLDKIQSILACEIECGIFETHVLPALNVVRSAALSVAQDERAACIHAEEPRACPRVRCQLGKKCVDDDMSPRPSTSANVAQGAEEPDCWAILTPNGSRLVSPEEAKGRLYAYPLYRAPPAPPALTDDARDAERYRRIRLGLSDRHGDVYAMVFAWEGDYPESGEKLDATIDAALTAAQSASEGNNAG